MRGNLRTVDLHTHSTASDGSMSPSQLVNTAAANGIGVLSLTDHDTVAGYAEAEYAASSLDIELVAGIEVSSYYDGVEYHVLGYFVESGSSALKEYELDMRSHRSQRVEEILARLRTSGIVIAAEDVSVDGGTPTRLHIALAMVEHCYVQDIREAFNMYLGAGSPAYVPAAKIDTRAAIDLIHDVGGVASLAHPGDWTHEEHVGTFVSWGLDALEVIHPSHDDRLADYYGRLAHRFGLRKTGGSDFHAPDTSGDVGLGRHSIPFSWYAELKCVADGASSR